MTVEMPESGRPRVVLAYSGGLDTSCILAWLIDSGYDVLCYIANVGQEEDFEEARCKALRVGAKKVFVEDLRKQFVEEFVFPAIQANLIYDNVYLLGTALARPVIARRQVEIALQENCAFVAHGCTGKGNDQVRFELAYYALAPHIKVLAPWRDPDFFNTFRGRSDLLAYAKEKRIPVVQTAAKPWSVDENMFHTSYEGGPLEDPSFTPPKDMWKMTVDPEDAPDSPETLTIHFERGIPVKVENLGDSTVRSGPLALFEYVNNAARRHGVGRIDIVENRFIGIKSRGCYETPGGTVLRAAHMDLEGLTMDGQVRKTRDTTVTPQLAGLFYNGLYFSPERRMLAAASEASQATVTGSVTVKLYKGGVAVLGRESRATRLYDPEQSSMDALGDMDPEDAGGFIRTLAVRLKNFGAGAAKEGGGRA